MSLEEKYQIIQAKQKGMSTKEIAEKYGHPMKNKLDLFDIFRLMLIFIHILCTNLFLL
jgi:hypothetical protein